MTEDHPVKYLTFEGTIPKGNYGAGEMSIWDSGTYEMANGASFEKALESGKLKFRLHGQKLHGEFSLVKMHGDEDRQWLLIKSKDEAALAKADSPKKKPKKTGEFSEYLRPMLAKLGDGPFDADDWIFEKKLDGYRAIAEANKGTVRLYSRNGKNFENTYNSIFQSLKKIDHEAILDGEIVALDSKGVPDFNLLQNFKNSQKGRLRYMAFDLLYLNGENTTALPLTDRKALLKQLLENQDGDILYLEHHAGLGKDFFKKTVKQGYEGIMAKKANSHYLLDSRSPDWLKIKAQKTADAVIGGFTVAKDNRAFGALVLGMYDDSGELVFAGHCGTGFGRETIQEIHRRLVPQDVCPFSKKPKVNAKVTWVRPTQVCEVAFAAWTKNKYLRHPSFQRMRDDKKPEEVRLANEMGLAAPPEKITAATMKTKKIEQEQIDRGKDFFLDVGKNKVKITSPDRVYFPKHGYTKAETLNYYLEMADYILPYLKNRPESLFRTPQGVGGKDFFQKDINFSIPEFASTAAFYSESAEKEIDWLVCNNLETLLFMVNLGTIEINPWNSTIDKPNHPDYAAIDLDPGDKTQFKQVVETALATKAVLDEAGIEGHCKTSGSRGLHIFIPLAAKYEYDDVRDFIKAIVLLVHGRLPKLTSLERSPSERRRQIYLDWLQNKQGQTLVAPYSLRPREHATVSTPLKWEEVNFDLDITDFTIKTVPGRVKKLGDRWAPVLQKGIDMEKALERLLEQNGKGK
jgi:bifunctional non-homologous end joining protein LigD